jgi:RimJ/RimL family protein N-acetyltransferase
MHGDGKQVEVFYRSLSETTRVIFPGYPFTDEEAHRLAKEETDDPGMRRYLVTDPSSGQMIGTVWFWHWDRMVPWIGLMIADAYQGQGVGKAMLAYAIRAARDEGKGGILLTTHKENVRGQSLYARYGFEVIGQDPREEHLMILRF